MCKLHESCTPVQQTNRVSEIYFFVGVLILRCTLRAPEASIGAGVVRRAAGPLCACVFAQRAIGARETDADLRAVARQAACVRSSTSVVASCAIVPQPKQ
jgi:hypothetical protein